MKKLFTLVILSTVLFLASCKKGDDQRLRVLLTSNTGPLEKCNIQVLSTAATLNYSGTNYNSSLKLPQSQLDLVKFNNSDEILATADNLSGGDVKEIKITLGECSVQKNGKVFKLYFKDPVFTIPVNKGLENSLTDVKILFNATLISDDGRKIYIEPSCFQLLN